MARFVNIVQAVGFGLLLLGWASWNQGHGSHPRTMTSEELRAAKGTSKQYHVQTIQTCAEEEAAALGPPFVANDGCTANNVGARCVICDPGSASNMLTQQGSDGGPGIKPAEDNPWSCGSESVGVCNIVNGVAGCRNPQPQSFDCLPAWQYWNQP